MDAYWEEALDSVVSNLDSHLPEDSSGSSDSEEYDGFGDLDLANNCVPQPKSVATWTAAGSLAVQARQLIRRRKEVNSHASSSSSKQLPSATVESNEVAAAANGELPATKVKIESSSSLESPPARNRPRIINKVLPVTTDPYL